MFSKAVQWIKSEYQFLAIFVPLISIAAGLFGGQFTVRHRTDGESPGVIIITQSVDKTDADPVVVQGRKPVEGERVVKVEPGAVVGAAEGLSPRAKAMILATLKVIAMISPNQYDNMLVEILQKLWADPEGIKAAYRAVTGKEPPTK